MRILTIRIESLAPYSQAKKHEEPKLKDESHEDYDRRTWREHCTTNEEGVMCIPGMAIKMAIDSAARKLQEKNSTKKFGKSFIDYIVGGIFPHEQMFPIGVLKEETKNANDKRPVVGAIAIWANLDGRRGSNKRGFRRYPIVPKYKAIIQLDVMDDSIPTDVVERHVIEAGATVGIGRFRPENGGMNGRFRVRSFEWSDEQEELEEAA